MNPKPSDTSENALSIATHVDGIPRCSTIELSVQLGIVHAELYRQVEDNQKAIEKLSGAEIVKQEVLRPKDGKPCKGHIYALTEYQAHYLLDYLPASPIVVRVRHQIIQEFLAMKAVLQGTASVEQEQLVSELAAAKTEIAELKERPPTKEVVHYLSTDVDPMSQEFLSVHVYLSHLDMVDPDGRYQGLVDDLVFTSALGRFCTQYSHQCGYPKKSNLRHPAILGGVGGYYRCVLDDCIEETYQWYLKRQRNLQGGPSGGPSGGPGRPSVRITELFG